VSEPEKLTVGGVEFGLIPIAWGETHDGLIIALPDREVVFTGDMSMPTSAPRSSPKARPKACSGPWRPSWRCAPGC
jgi:hypothetical protein